MAKHREALGMAYASLMGTGMSSREARRMAKAIVAEAATLSAGEPGEGSGELMLQKLKANPALYEARQREGVRDSDVRSFWDKGGVYQHTMSLINEQARMAMFLHEQQKAVAAGASDTEAARAAGKEVRAMHPVYGDPADAPDLAPADRPLYHELRERIDRILAPRLQLNPAPLIAELESATSFNAWAREQLAART